MSLKSPAAPSRFRAPPSPVADEFRMSATKARSVMAGVRAELRSAPEGELFREHLTEFQLSEMYATGFIPVRGSEGNEYYVGVWPVDRLARVWARDPKGQLGKHYCLVVTTVTQYDAVIAKVLLIQADEKKFVRVAY